MTRSIFSRIPTSDLNVAHVAGDSKQRDLRLSSLRSLGSLRVSAVRPLLRPGLIVLLTSPALFGCMGKVRYPTYYTLHVAPATDPPPKEQPIGSIAIREFRAPSYLRQGPIVFHSSPEQLGFYEYHRWAVDPREFV